LVEFCGGMVTEKGRDVNSTVSRNRGGVRGSGGRRGRALSRYEGDDHKRNILEIRTTQGPKEKCHIKVVGTRRKGRC